MSGRYAPDTLALCRAALAKGPLVRDVRHWRFGRRRFNPATVAALIASGEAVRSEYHIIAAVPPATEV